MTYKVIDLSQGSPEWHAWRKKSVGASDSAIILGVSPYKTALKLWAEKSGLVTPDDLSKNPNVARGVRLEPQARFAAEKRLNQGLLLPLCVEGIGDMAGIIASCDAVTEAGIPLEIKVPAASTLERVKTLGEQSPEVQLYKIQLQHQMMLLDATKGYLFFFDSEGGESQLFEFEKNQNMQADIQKACKVFLNCLASNNPPDADPERDIMELSNEDEIAYLVLEERKKELQDELAAVTRQQKTIIESKEEVIKAAGYKSGKFGTIKVTIYERQGAVDFTALVKENAPALLDKAEDYRKAASLLTRVSIEKA